MKLYSWNVNGIRAVINKGAFQKFIAEHDPDILCLQETKVDSGWVSENRETIAVNDSLGLLRQDVAVATSRSKKQADVSAVVSQTGTSAAIDLPAEQGQAIIDYPQYHENWSSATKKGYSGTAIFSKAKPLSVIVGFPEDIVKKFKLTDALYGGINKEGRMIAAEFEKFYVVTVYTPNSKGDLSRINLRHKHWDPAFLAYVKGLEAGKYQLSSEKNGLDEVQGAAEQRTAAVQTGTAKGAAQDATQQFAKPVLFCGDLNVAHQEIDLANPKANVKNHGFTIEERAGFDNFVSAGFVDTFRMFTQGNGHYTWWTHWANARVRNVGWRIDYWLASKKIAGKIKAAAIHPDVMGSDHCPVSIEIVL